MKLLITLLLVCGLGPDELTSLSWFLSSSDERFLSALIDSDYVIFFGGFICSLETELQKGRQMEG